MLRIRRIDCYPEVSSMRPKIPTGVIKSAIVNKSLKLMLPAVLLGLLWPFTSMAQEMNKQFVSQDSIDAQCITNLKRIYGLIKYYMHLSGGALKFPDNLDKIDLMAKDQNLFICPGDKQINTSVTADTFRTSYEIVNDPLKPKLSGTPPDRIAIIAEERLNHDGKRF